MNFGFVRTTAVTGSVAKHPCPNRITVAADPPGPEINDCYEIEGPAGSEESDHCDDDEHYFREEMIDDDEISIHSSMCLDVDGMADGRSAGGSGEQCSSGSSERLTLDSAILATTQTNLPLLCRPSCSIFRACAVRSGTRSKRKSSTSSR